MDIHVKGGKYGVACRYCLCSTYAVYTHMHVKCCEMCILYVSCIHGIHTRHVVCSMCVALVHI